MNDTDTQRDASPRSFLLAPAARNLRPPYLATPPRCPPMLPTASLSAESSKHVRRNAWPVCACFRVNWTHSVSSQLTLRAHREVRMLNRLPARLSPRPPPHRWAPSPLPTSPPAHIEHPRPTASLMAAPHVVPHTPMRHTDGRRRNRTPNALATRPPVLSNSKMFFRISVRVPATSPHDIINLRLQYRRLIPLKDN